MSFRWTRREFLLAFLVAIAIAVAAPVILLRNGQSLSSSREGSTTTAPALPEGRPRDADKDVSAAALGQQNQAAQRAGPPDSMSVKSAVNAAEDAAGAAAGVAASTPRK